MAFPTELATPLPLDHLVLAPRAAAALAAVLDAGAGAVCGLDVSLVPAVAAAARQPAIVEFCPNDGTRFADEPAARKWAAKGRSFVAVLDPGVAAGSLGHGADPAAGLLAYGWSGPERNEHVPGADVTTAYRVTDAGQAFARRVRAAGRGDFRLGLLLGELVIGAAVAVGGVTESEVSLETWASNRAARRVYADLGFVQPDGVPEVPAVRPTLQALGVDVAGAIVRADPTDPSRRLVDDRRCFYVLRR